MKIAYDKSFTRMNIDEVGHWKDRVFIKLPVCKGYTQGRDATLSEIHNEVVPVLGIMFMALQGRRENENSY